MGKVIGNTTATPNPRPDWLQMDETKADFIKNKPVILTEEQIRAIIREMIAEANTPSDTTVTIKDEVLYVLSDWAITVEDEVLCVSSDRTVTVKDGVLYVQ